MSIEPLTVDEVTITEVINKELNCTTDIVVEFPEYWNLKPVSFTEVGLYNAKGDLKENTNGVTPITTIEFFGKLQKRYE